MTESAFDKRGPVEPGTIVPYSGDLSQIPTGWAVCDGNNTTPDLRDKLIKSTNTASEGPRSTGGKKTKSVSESQLPSHSHTGDSGQAGSHVHTIDLGDVDQPAWSDTANLQWIESSGPGGAPVDSNGDHSHTASVQNSGSDSSYDNQPAYVEMLFIKKL